MAGLRGTRSGAGARLFAGAAALLVLAACGSDTADDEKSTAADSPSSDLPTCSSIWVTGEDLPEDYSGCLEDDETVKPEIIDCSSGQRIVTFNDEYWAVRGEIIGHAPAGLDDDEPFADVLYSCRA